MCVYLPALQHKLEAGKLLVAVGGVLLQHELSASLALLQESAACAPVSLYYSEELSNGSVLIVVLLVPHS